MSFDLDFSKDRQRLMASGACLAVGTLAAGLNDTTSPAGLMAGVLAGLGSNIMASDIDAHLARRVARSREVLGDESLSLAVGRAIDLVVHQAADDSRITADDRRAVKALAKNSPALWNELAPLRGADECLAPLAEVELIGFLAVGADEVGSLTVLEPHIWSEVVSWMAEKGKITLRPGTVNLLAADLHRHLPSYLRKILEQDFASDGRAYASLQMLVWGELLRALAELKLDVRELRSEQQAELEAILGAMATANLGIRGLVQEDHRELIDRMSEVTTDLLGVITGGHEEIHAKLDKILAWQARQSPSPAGHEKGGPSDPAVVPAPSTALPPPHNPRYLPREDKDGGDVLVALHDRIKAARRVVLHGMPAVGKTEAAREYAHRHSVERPDFRRVYWTPAGTEDQLLAGLSGMARRMGLPTDRPPVEILGAIKAQLELDDGWLWVVENVEDIGMVSRYLPAPVSGRVLITTTRPEAEFRGLGAMTVELTHFRDRDDGASFLLRLAGLMDGGQELGRPHPDDVAAARGISEGVGGLPLALDQAAAFIEATNGSAKEYLAEYGRRGGELRRLRSPLPAMRDHECVTLTFSLLFDRLEEEHPASADLLRTLAFFSPGAIPEEILSIGATALGESLGHAASADLPMTRMHALRDRLITYDPRGRTFGFHVLVRDVLLDRMDGDARLLWAGRAVHAINLTVPEVNDFDLNLANRMLPHLEQCARHVEEYGLRFAEAGRVVDKAGCYLFYYGRRSESLPLLERALAITQDALGPGHPDTARTLNNLAVLLHQRGDHDGAEEFYLAALAIRERELGPNHRDTAITLDNLGGLKHARCRLPEAEKFAQRALAIRRNAPVPDGSQTALSLSNLGSIVMSQGKLAEAASLHREALEIRRAKLGPGHPWTVVSLSQLAGVLRMLGEWDEAGPIYGELLANRGAQFQADSQLSSAIEHEIGGFFEAKGEFAEAESAHRKAIAHLREMLGPEHIHTADSMGEMARFLRERGRLEDAESFARRSLGIVEAKLGHGDPAVASFRNRLAAILFDRGKYSEAEGLFLASWKSQKQALGSNDARTKGSLQDYLSTLRRNGRHAKFDDVVSKLKGRLADWVRKAFEIRG